ncbi:MAG: hypothetical protein U9P44_03630, partial [archaeon]|nr:hypothetical protein [archaeon]
MAAKPIPMEPFMYVFITAMVLFFTLFFLFGQEPIEDTSDDNPDISDKGTYVFCKEYINLVSNRTQSVRTIDFGDFDVGYTSLDATIQDLDELLIEKGLLRSSSKTFNFNGTGMESVVLRFTVDDSNDYGNMKVYFNDETVFDNRTEKGQRYEMEFKNILGYNEIRIEAHSSGFRLWAPTTYVLSDIHVSALRYDDVDKMFSFIVYDYELVGFDAILNYEAGSGSIREGNLYIEINGNDINEQKKPMFGTIYREKFNRLDGVIAAKPDTNYIRFSADKDAKYEMRDAQMTISYFDTDQAAISEHRFFISDETYDDMDNKTIV